MGVVCFLERIGRDRYDSDRAVCWNGVGGNGVAGIGSVCSLDRIGGDRIGSFAGLVWLGAVCFLEWIV